MIRNWYTEKAHGMATVRDFVEMGMIHRTGYIEGGVDAGSGVMDEGQRDHGMSWMQGAPGQNGDQVEDAEVRQEGKHIVGMEHGR